MKFDPSNIAFVCGFSIIFLIIIVMIIKNRRSLGNSKPNKRKNVIITLKNPDSKYKFTLAHKENVSHDTRLFRFQLQSTKHVLGLPIGQHIYITAHINGELVKRPYTPITSDDCQGYFDLVIKIYPHGKMTQYLDKFSIGETIDVSGPAGNLIYKGNGLFDIRSRKPELFVSKRVRRLGLIAGGSGITPMYQLLNAILKEQASIIPDNRTDIKIWLLFANQTEQDILLREELEQLAASNRDQFKLWYTIDRANDEWKYSKGFINETMLQEHMPPPDDNVLICICGPPPMIKYACVPNLDILGYTESMRHTF